MSTNLSVRFLVKPMVVRGSQPLKTLNLIYDLDNLRREPDLLPNHVVHGDLTDVADFFAGRAFDQDDWQVMTSGYLWPKDAEKLVA